MILVECNTKIHQITDWVINAYSYEIKHFYAGNPTTSWISILGHQYYDID